MTAPRDPDEYRVAFDFEILFSNGGGLKGWDFRLDIEGETISDEELASYIVRDLRLLMVGSVAITSKRVFREKHKRGATAKAVAATGPAAERIVDLSRAGDDGSRIHLLPDPSGLALSRLVDLPAITVRLTGMSGNTITKLALAPALENPEGKAILIETGCSEENHGSHPVFTDDAALYLASLGVALVGIDAPAQRSPAILRDAGIPLITGLASLGSLPISGFRFSAVPTGTGNSGIASVRAWAVHSA